MAETLRLNKKLFDARLSGSQQDKVAPQAGIGGLRPSSERLSPCNGQLHSWIPSHLMGTMDSTSLDAMFATAEEHHRDPGLIRVPIHALVPLKLKYPYMSASNREAAVRLLRVGKRLSESAD